MKEFFAVEGYPSATNRFADIWFFHNHCGWFYFSDLHWNSCFRGLVMAFEKALQLRQKNFSMGSAAITPPGQEGWT